MRRQAHASQRAAHLRRVDVPLHKDRAKPHCAQTTTSAGSAYQHDVKCGPGELKVALASGLGSGHAERVPWTLSLVCWLEAFKEVSRTGVNECPTFPMATEAIWCNAIHNNIMVAEPFFTTMCVQT